MARRNGSARSVQSVMLFNLIGKLIRKLAALESTDVTVELFSLGWFSDPVIARPEPTIEQHAPAGKCSRSNKVRAPYACIESIFVAKHANICILHG
ncbi:hypothetical protein COLO4_27534 [Corchorus olitorius]|uniref:Uncharacterized protein n=1 Tax=Corchorus olitorius TaxID=93759 RepID=A0A1R3HR01_9ROSI|nr:hypothetical protein COLO4_27534 [Corchorus olitorius]